MGLLMEREGEEFLLRPGETLGEEGMQLLGILHTHQKALWRDTCFDQSGHSKHQCRTLYGHSLQDTRPDSSGVRKGWVLDAISRTPPSPAEEQTIPNQAVELRLCDSRDPGGHMEQFQGQWQGVCVALEKSAGCRMVSCLQDSPSVGSLRPHI